MNNEKTTEYLPYDSPLHPDWWQRFKDERSRKAAAENARRKLDKLKQEVEKAKPHP